jgi:hypothetical protein
MAYISVTAAPVSVTASHFLSTSRGSEKDAPVAFGTHQPA